MLWWFLSLLGIVVLTGCGSSSSDSLPSTNASLLGFDQPTFSLVDSDCYPLRVTTLENPDTVVIQPLPFEVGLESSDPLGVFFLDPDCTVQTQSVQIQSGETSVRFYLRSPTQSDNHLLRAVATNFPSVRGELEYSAEYSLVGKWRLLCRQFDDSTFVTTYYDFASDGTYEESLFVFRNDPTCQNIDFKLSFGGSYTVGPYQASETRSVDKKLEFLSMENKISSWSDSFSCKHPWLAQGEVNLLFDRVCVISQTEPRTIYDVYQADGTKLRFGKTSTGFDKSLESKRPGEIDLDPDNITRKIR